jgi:hypothetical protein
LGERIIKTPTAQVWTSHNISGQTVVLKIAADVPWVQKRFERELFAMVATANRHVMLSLDYDPLRAFPHSYLTPKHARDEHAPADAIPR